MTSIIEWLDLETGETRPWPPPKERLLKAFDRIYKQIYAMRGFEGVSAAWKENESETNGK